MKCVFCYTILLFEITLHDNILWLQLNLFIQYNTIYVLKGQWNQDLRMLKVYSELVSYSGFGLYNIFVFYNMKLQNNFSFTESLKASFFAWDSNVLDILTFFLIKYNFWSILKCTLMNTQKTHILPLTIC